MAALSRGCKPRIREGSTLRIYPRPVAFLTGKVPCERTYITAQLWSVRNIVNKGSFKNFNGTFYETKPQVSQQQFRNPRSGSSAVYVL